MGKENLELKAKFDFIRYANCWEDADILLAGLKMNAGGKVLSIASAGDNSLSLLTQNPEIVVAVDINQVQLFLTEFKMICFQELNYNEVLELLGVSESVQRLSIYKQIKRFLSKEALIYWDKNIDIIEKGIIYNGKFEKYFSFFRKIILPFIHSSKTNYQLFDLKSLSEQEKFYNEKWNSKSWRLFFNVFFSEFILGRFGRDPAFLKQVEIPVSKFIFNKAEKHLKSIESQQNYFLKFILHGVFDEENLPHYLRLENFQTIKKNISKIKLIKGYAQDAFSNYPQFDYFNLSNIFEYMPAHIFTLMSNELSLHSSKGAKFAYWNLMVQRNLAIEDEQKYKYLESNSNKLSSIDKGFFYQNFIINERI